eukprot:5435740-Karenia_brevis.AAC.1
MKDTFAICKASICFSRAASQLCLSHPSLFCHRSSFKVGLLFLHAEGLCNDVSPVGAVGMYKLYCEINGSCSVTDSICIVPTKSQQDPQKLIRPPFVLPLLGINVASR